MTDTPFFSIIMPVYNAAPYLRECLESILAQDFSDWEAILVDDHSSDSSADIAEEFSHYDTRIRLFKSEKNSGGAHTPRLKAASLARAERIVTVDADDKLSPDLLSKLYDHINTDNADLVIPEMWKMKGEECYKLLPLDSIDIAKIWNGRDLVAHTLIKWEIPMCGFATKREIYLAADSHISADERKSIFADELHSRWLLSMCHSVAMCNARYFYRYNTESVTNVNLPRIIQSRLLTADSLIAMTSSTFGKESPTYIRSLENKLYKAVDLLRLISSSDLTPGQTRTCVRLVSSAMKDFNLVKLKGMTSPRYLALMRLPLPFARIVLKIIDFIIKK